MGIYEISAVWEREGCVEGCMEGCVSYAALAVAQYVSPACYQLTTKSNLISQASTSTRLGASEWASRHFTEPMNGSTASWSIRARQRSPTW